MVPVLMFGGSRQTMQRARAVGVEPLLLQRPADHDEAYRPLVADLRVVDYDDPAAVLAAARAMYRARPFVRAVSVTEAGLLPAARINERFGLGGTPLRSVRLLTDKWRMRRLLNQIGLSAVAAAEVTDAGGVARFAAVHGFPVIVKPVDGTASVAVFRVDEPGEVGAVWERVLALGLRRMLVEEYLTGPEISVEAFSFGTGRHHVVAMTGKVILPNFVEVCHVVPAELSDDQVRQVSELVVAFLDVVEHTDGPSHTEVKLTPSGPRIVESHNRQGGDRITDLVELVHGVDLIRLGLAWASGQATPWRAAPAARGAAAIRFLTPEPGPVGAVTGADEVRTWPGVIGVHLDVGPGGHVAEVRSSHDRAGCVVVYAEDAPGALRLATEAAAHIRFHPAAVTV